MRLEGWTLLVGASLVVVSTVVVCFGLGAPAGSQRSPRGMRDWLSTALLVAALLPGATLALDRFPANDAIGIAVALGVGVGARLRFGRAGATPVLFAVSALAAWPVLGVVVGALAVSVGLALDAGRAPRRSGIALMVVAIALGVPVLGGTLAAPLVAIPAFAVLSARPRPGHLIDGPRAWLIALRAFVVTLGIITIDRVMRTDTPIVRGEVPVKHVLAFALCGVALMVVATVRRDLFDRGLWGRPYLRAAIGGATVASVASVGVQRPAAAPLLVYAAIATMAALLTPDALKLTNSMLDIHLRGAHPHPVAALGRRAERNIGDLEENGGGIVGLFKKRETHSEPAPMRTKATLEVSLHEDGLADVSFMDVEKIVRDVMDEKGDDASYFGPESSMPNRLQLALLFFARVVNCLEGGGLEWRSLVRRVYEASKTAFESDWVDGETIAEFLPDGWRWGMGVGDSNAPILASVEASLVQGAGPHVGINAAFSLGGEDRFPEIECLAFLEDCAMLTNNEPPIDVGLPAEYPLLLASLMAQATFYEQNPEAVGDVTREREVAGESLLAGFQALTTNP